MGREGLKTKHFLEKLHPHESHEIQVQTGQWLCV